MTRMLLITALAILAANIAIAQDNAKLPTFSIPLLKDAGVSVPDAGFVRHRSRARTSREILARALPAHMNNSVCSKKVADGTTTYDIIHDRKPLAITIHEDGKLEIKMIRRYTRDNIDQLKAEHPELARQVSALPTTIDGNAIVALSLDVEIAVTANNADELKANHPDVHAIFARYTKPAVITLSKKLGVVVEPE